MILDRTWNKKEQKLVISYIDKLGNRQFFQKYIHHIKSYEYDSQGEYTTWDGKKCKKIFKETLDYTPNEFEILEFMYELPKDINQQFHAQYFPKLYFFDIETEISSEFPDPEKADQKVTSISLVGPDLSCIVYGLHDLTEDQIALFRKRYLDWLDNNEFASALIKNNGWKPKVLYQYFPSEEKMLEHFFTIIIPKIGCLAGWNSYGFDMLYMTTRLVKLFGKSTAMTMIRKSSPTGEIKRYSWEDISGEKKFFFGPAHSILLDYMEIVKQYDHILTYESFSLDWVGNAAVKAHKIKYQGSLQQLYERDPEWYYFYNGIDSLIGELIHYKLKAIESPCAVSSVTLVPLQAAFGQVALGTANVFEEFYSQGKKVVWDYDAIERVKVPYEGAFCGCVPGRYEFTVCDDFASLYPSQVRTCNLSFENLYEKRVGPDSFGRYTTMKWSEAELEEFKKDPNYFVTVMGNVYKNDKDYTFRIVQAKLKANRDKFKYTGQKLDSEMLVEIDRLIAGKPGDPMKFHDDVIALMKEKFPTKFASMYNMTIEELKSFRIEVEDLRHEYSLLELAMKLLGNGLYGCCANRFFYFYNMALAGDITGECRHLTKTMWHNLEEFFHNTIWERKDLWQRFNFELDELKHEWYKTTPVSVYSDTDSVYTTYGNLFRCMLPKYQELYNTKKSKVDWILKFNKEFLDGQNNQWCRDIYDPRHGKNVHEFELETVSYAQICIKKKKYLKGYAFVKGKYYETPKVSGTGIELVKSTTPKLCRTILTDLMNSLMFDYNEEHKDEYILTFNNKLAEFRKQFYKAQEEDISQSVGIGDYKKYVIEDKNNLTLGKGCPVSVQAIARYNYLAHKNGEDNKIQYSGKIKYYNIVIGNKIGYFGYPAGELPTWAPPISKITQWEKNVVDPINRFLEVMDIPKVNAGTAIQLSLF